jgi:hypothetical protein
MLTLVTIITIIATNVVKLGLKIRNFGANGHKCGNILAIYAPRALKR